MKAMWGCTLLGWLCYNCKRLSIKGHNSKEYVWIDLKLWPEVPEHPYHLYVDLVTLPPHSVHQKCSIVSLDRKEKDIVGNEKIGHLTTPVLPPTRPVSHLNNNLSSVWCTSKQVCTTCIHCPLCPSNNSQSCSEENRWTGCNLHWSTSGC